MARSMALGAAGLIWMGLALQYEVRVAFQRHLEASAIASTSGLILGIASVAGIGVQLVVTPRILGRWGAGVALVILPVTIALLMGSYLWAPLLIVVAAASVADKTLRPGLHRPAESCLVGALPRACVHRCSW